MTDSTDVNPYPTTEPIPYDPDDPVFTEPVVPLPEPELEHLSAEEAIARQQEQAPPAEAVEPTMVTQYKQSYA